MGKKRSRSEQANETLAAALLGDFGAEAAEATLRLFHEQPLPLVTPEEMHRNADELAERIRRERRLLRPPDSRPRERESGEPSHRERVRRND